MPIDVPPQRRGCLAKLLPAAGQWRAAALPLLLCALSGLACPLIFRRYAIGELAWVVLVPFLAALASPALTRRLLPWAAFLFGMCWHYMGLWFLHTLVAFNPFIPVGVVLAAGIEMVYMMAFVPPAAFCLRRMPAPVAAPLVAALWTAVEYLRCFTDLAMPWNLLSHSQLDSVLSPIRGCAAWAGAYPISFAIVMANASLALLIVRRRKPAGAIAACAASVLLAGALCLIGQATISSPPASVGTLRVAVIQPNIPQPVKWTCYAPETPEGERVRVETHVVRKTCEMTIAASRLGTKPPQLYVLPETTFPSPWFVYDTAIHEMLGGMAQQLRADILFGADNRESVDSYRARRKALRDADATASVLARSLPVLRVVTNDDGTTGYREAGEMAMFNSLWKMESSGTLNAEVYDKMQLVPFGETAPLVDMIPLLQEKIMMIGSFQKGLQQATWETSGVRYGGLVCFESGFPHLARGLARAGAQMICVLTNDGWYDPAYMKEHPFWGRLFALPFIRMIVANGPDNHYTHSIFRAIETGLPVVRAANNGISAIIRPDGTEVERTDFAEDRIFAADVAVPAGSHTFHARHGDWFAQLCLAMLVVTWGLMLVAAYRNKQTTAA